MPHKVKPMCHVEGTKRPRCQAKREGHYLTDACNISYQCVFTARYWFDGERLCARHASVKALQIMLEEQV